MEGALWVWSAVRMRFQNEEQEDHSAQNRGDCGGPPLTSALDTQEEALWLKCFSFCWSGLREVRALVYWEKPHFSTEWKIVTANDDKGTAPRTQPCPSTPRTGKFGNVGMMHPTHFLLEHLRR